MNLKQAIELCVNDRIENSKELITNVDVLINTKRKFIQVNGVFYNFGSIEASESIFVCFKEDVDNWESDIDFLKKNCKIRSIKIVNKSMA